MFSVFTYLIIYFTIFPDSEFFHWTENKHFQVRSLSLLYKLGSVTRFICVKARCTVFRDGHWQWNGYLLSTQTLFLNSAFTFFWRISKIDEKKPESEWSDINRQGRPLYNAATLLICANNLFHTSLDHEYTVRPQIKCLPWKWHSKKCCV